MERHMKTSTSEVPFASAVEAELYSISQKAPKIGNNTLPQFCPIRDIFLNIYGSAETQVLYKTVSIECVYTISLKRTNCLLVSSGIVRQDPLGHKKSFPYCALSNGKSPVQENRIGVTRLAISSSALSHVRG